MRIHCAEEEDFPGQAELWAANVERSLKGKRGQASLRELETALLALPEKQLIADDLQDATGRNCALAALAKLKGVDIPKLAEPEDEYDEIAVHDQMVSLGERLGVPRLVATEIVYRNDDDWRPKRETPEERYQRMLRWTQRQLQAHATV